MTILNMLRGSTYLRAPDDGGGTGGGTGGAGGGTGGGTGNAPWYQGVAGVDETMVSHWANKGWDKLSAPELAVKASSAWKEAEKLIGVPADQVVRLPSDANAPEWGGVYNRLGRPDTADGYDFKDLKFSDGTEIGEDFIKAISPLAHKVGVSKAGMRELTDGIIKFLDSSESAEAAESAATLEAQKAALDKNWGTNKAANLLVAQAAIRALGWDPAMVSALESVVGYDKIMEGLRTLGTRLGEHNFIGGGPNNPTGVMTRDQAVAKRTDLMKDKEWVTRYMNGGSAETREMQALTKIIIGQAA